MKKLVIAVLAIGAMVACTKQNVQFEQPDEISIQPVAQKATKAAVDGAYYPTGEAYNFNVWAWWSLQNAGTALEDFTGTSPYIKQGTFTARNNVSWGGVTPYYWPTSGSLVFAGYSPASAKSSAESFVYIPSEKKLTVTNYTQSNDISKTLDLMWFDVTDKSYDQKTAADGVPAVFQHALSWLTFKFNLASGAPANNWVVTKVDLVGIENKATFTSPSTWTEPVDATTATNMTVYSGSHPVSTTLTALENGSALIIPQSCATTNDASLVITYNLKNPAHTSDSSIPEWLTNQTVTLPLNGTKSGATWDAWAPGKHYIYTITFGANEILIAPTVATWDGPVTQDINVQ